MTSVPAKRFVNTGGSVLPVGGSDIVLNGMFLTASTRVPIGTVLQFANATLVGNYFGAGSTEALEAAVYFNGWDGSTQKPGNILFTQYPTAALGVAAYLRGGSIASIPIATLQGYNGTFALTVDGIARTGSVNFSALATQSLMAAAIATALNTSLTTICSFTGVISGTTLTTSAVTGTILAGMTVLGAGITGSPYIVKQLTGTTGGAGTYQLSASFTIGSEAMTTQATPVVGTYDSTSGAFVITSGATGAAGSSITFPTTNTFVTNILMTAATGAVLSQGADTGVPGTFMAALANIIQNWVSFTTLFDPDGGSGFANKLLFTQWCNGAGTRYVYVPFDLDPNAATQAVGTFAGYGAALQTGNYNGTAPVWELSGGRLAAFLMGMIASVDFNAIGGRVSFAAKSQAGLVPGVTTDTAFLNLAGDPQSQGSFGNGYNCYAAIATANANFQWFQRSTVSGTWKWLDAYLNAIWLDNTGQLALMTGFGTLNAIPFTPQGANTIRTILQPVIKQGLQFGAFGPGIILSGSQIVAVNNAAGQDIATTLQNVGYYLLILPASAAVRANRGPWQIVLYYCDQGVVQSVNFSTVAIQ